MKLISEHQHTSMGALLEHWRNDDISHYMAKLASWNHLLPIAELSHELQGALKLCVDRVHEHQIKKLMTKAAAKGLSDDEKRLLQALISDKKPS